MNKIILFGVVFLFSLGLVNSALTDNNLVYYSFDEDNTTGTTMIDLSSNGFNGTCTNMVSNCNTQTGLLINASDLDGVNDYIIRNQGTNIIDTTNDFTISMWVNLDITTGTQNLFGQITNTANDDIVQIQTVSGTLYGFVSTPTGFSQPNSAYVLTAGNWEHIILMKNGTNMEIFVNGIKKVTTGFTGGSYSGTSTYWALGVRGSYLDQITNGQFDEFGIWNKTLSQSEIDELYNSGNGINPYKLISTDIQPYYNLENISINITTLNNVNLNYSLDGASNLSIWTNNNSGTLNLYNLTIGTHNITFYDTTNNISLNETFQYQPYQYLYFTNATGGTISNFQLNNISYVDYANFTIESVGTKSFTFVKTGFNTTTFSRTFTINTQLNETISMPFTKIIVSIYDKDTSSILTGTTDLTLVATQGATGTTTTGYFNFTNEDFIAGNYQIIAEHENYNTESVYFTFDNQETLNVNIYMLNSTATDIGTITIKTVADTGQLIEGAICSAKEWQSNSSSYVVVSQGQTDTNGETELTIQLNTKLYEFTCSKDSTTATSNSQIITSTGTSLPLTMVISSLTITPLFENLVYNLTNSTYNATHQRIIFDWRETNNVAVEGCLKIYTKLGLTLNLLQSSCSTTTDGEIQLIQNINQSNTIIAQAYISDVLIDEIIFENQEAFFSQLKDYKLQIFVPIIFIIIGLALGFALSPENIFISIIGMMVGGVLAFMVVPSIISFSTVFIIWVLGSLMIWGGSKQ